MKYKSLDILGLMSGSSMDGIDLAICHFEFDQPMSWKISETASIPFDEDWKGRLQTIKQLNIAAYHKINAAYGKYLGHIIYDFIQVQKIKVDYAAVHGHTLYHAPAESYTIQMGSGPHMAEAAQIPIIDQFRIQDIIDGGQGAPLAHMADLYLLPGYDFYLNIGGIANVSIINENGFNAYDMCGANQILNRLAQEMGKPYDKGGEVARRGKVFSTLLEELLHHPYLLQDSPKSLDNQYTLQEFYSPFTRVNLSIEDKLATATEFVARAIAQDINSSKTSHTDRLLITGGGAFNTFLIERIQANLEHTQVVLPDPTIIEYKEAALMAYCGALRVWGKTNCRAEVTGASRNTVNGTIHYPQNYFK